MNKLRQKIFNVKALAALATLAILIALLIGTNSTALAFINGTQNIGEQSNTDEDNQFGYGEPGTPLPPGTTDIRGAATTDGRFIRDVDASSEDGKCSIHIPTGTVGLDKNLQPITELSVKPLSPAPEGPKDGNIIGIPYDFGPSGATFDPPITITFTYNPDDLNGADPSTLKIAIYVMNKTTGQYEWKTLTNIHVDPINHTISGDTDEFTPFAIIAPIPVTTTLAQTTTPAKTSPTTPAQTSPTTGPTTTAASSAPSATNWGLIGGLIAAAIVVVALLVTLMMRRKTNSA